jgi:hypothetical protein
MGGIVQFGGTAKAALAADMVMNESPGGLRNGLNTLFTTANTYASGSLQVFLNGQKLTATTDYTENDPQVNFSMAFAPLIADILTVSYIKA